MIGKKVNDFYTGPTHNKHIFVRSKKVAYLKKWAYFGKCAHFGCAYYELGQYLKINDFYIKF